MKNNNPSITQKTAQKTLTSNRGRNIVLISAIFLSTLTLSTILSICSNQIEMERRYMKEVHGITNAPIELSNLILIFLAFLLIIGGFLCIRSTMSVSISKDIRFYGLLGTIGMSAKQIKRVVFQQFLILCMIGIPLGLLGSVFVSSAVVPMYLKMYPKMSSADYPLQYHPWIYLLTTIFIFLTVLMGARKPAKCASKITPIEALRYSEYKYRREEIRSTAFSPLKMAWRNVFRVPKRSILVFSSLFLGMTMFLTISVILHSASADKFTEIASAHYKGDIFLRNTLPDQLMLDSDFSVFSQELMNDFSKLPGLSEMRVLYFYRMKMDVRNEEGEIRRIPGYLCGIDANGIAPLSAELEFPIDEVSFEQGNLVIVQDIWRSNLLDTEITSFYIDNNETPLSYTIGGMLPAEYQESFGTSYNRLPRVYMASDLLKELVGEPVVYEVVLDIERESQDQALILVKEWIEGYENISFLSRIEIRQESELIVSTLTVIGNCISSILILVGILNFINVMTSSVLSRRHEFALLESVGLSMEQSKKTLLYEGLLYACITLALVGIFGGSIIAGLFFAINQQAEYIVFRFPFTAAFFMIIAIFAVCISVPQLVYGFISKASIVERLREVE